MKIINSRSMRVFIFGLLMTGFLSIYTGLVFAQEASIEFTPEEKAWLAEHEEITVAFDGDYAPYSFQNEEGEFIGIAVDFAREVALRSGLRLNIYPKGTWKLLYDAALEHKVDVIATLVKRPEREELFEFTRPYISLAQYIITRKDNGIINRREDIAGKTLALVEKYSTTRYILEEFPDLIPYYLDSLTEAIEAVSIGRADATVAAMGMAQHLIAQQGLTNMRFAALYAQGLSEQRFGVRKDWPELASILDKALDSMKDDERLAIFQNWSHLEVAQVETVMAHLPPVPLTDDEKAWIKEHKEISLGVDHEFAPFEFVDDERRYRGMAADYIKLINERLGLEMKPVIGLIWSESVEKAKKREIDVLPSVGITEERKKYFNYSKSYVGFPRVIITRMDSTVSSIDNLSDKKVALQANSSHHGYLKDETDLKPVLYETFREAMLALSQGHNDAVIGNLAVATHVIQNMSLTNLKIPSHVSPKIFPLAFAVRKDWPELVNILNKTLDSITEDEKSAIRQRWVPVQVGQKQTDMTDLTEEEKAWLKEHPVIRVHNEMNWPPFNFNKNGQPLGYSIDYMNTLANSLGLKVEYVSGPSWNEFMGMIKARDLDVMLNIANTEERREYIHFTDGYFTALNGIYSKKSEQAITSLEQMVKDGLTMAVPKGFSNQKLLEKYYPKIKQVQLINQMDCIMAVLSGEADATMGREGVMNYLLADRMITGLKLTGLVDDERFKGVINIGVREDWPILRDIFQKAINAVQPDELMNLRKKWAVGGDESQGIELTEDEETWLADHRDIRLGVDPQWAPFEYFDATKVYSGIVSDYVRTLNTKLNIDMQPLKGLSWAQVIEKAKAGEIDILPAVMQSPERLEFLNFTKPYISLPMVILTRDDAPFIASIDELADKSIAVIKGYVTQELFSRDYPGHRFITVNNIEEALRSVSQGSTDAFIGNLASITYISQKLGITNLKVAGTTSYNFELAFAVRKDWPELVNILDRSLATFSDYEQNNIRVRWTNIKIEKQIDYSLSWKLILGAALLLAVFIYWNQRLANEVDERKQAQVLTERYEFIVNSVKDMMTFISNDYIYKAVNDKWCKTMGMERDTIIGKSVAEAWGNKIFEEDIKPNLDKCLSGEEISLKKWFKTGPKGNRHYDVTFYPYIEPGGETVHAVVVSRDITERTHTEESLLEANRALEFVQYAVEHAVDMAFWPAVEDARLIYVNKATAARLGYTKEELLNMHVPEIDMVITAEKWPQFANELKSSGSMTFESSLRAKNGDVFPVEVTASSIMFGNETRFVAFARDISDLKLAEHEIDSLFNLTKEGLVYVDKECNILKINDTFQYMWGGSKDEIIGKKCHEALKSVCHLKTAGEDSCNLARILAGKDGIEHEFTFVDKEGNERFMIESGMPFIESGEVIGLLKSFRDITERRRNEENLRKLSQAVEQSPVSVVITDQEGKIEYINPKFTEVTGYGFSEVFGQNPRILSSGTQSPEFYKDLWDTIKSGKEWRGEFANKKKSGKIFWENATISSIRNSDEKITHFIAVKEDITERKKAEQELHEHIEELAEARSSMLNMMEDLDKAKEFAEEATKAKSEFLANMSHELRTPLNSILGFSDVMKNEMAGPVTDPQKEYLNDIHESGVFLLDLINDILDLSKIEAGKMELDLSQFDLKTLIEGSLVMFKEKAMKHRIKVAIDIDEGISDINADERKIKQVVFNLLSNAMKFTPDGGSVSVTAQVSKDRKDYIEISIEDSGIGISPEDQKRLFQPFQQLESTLTKEHQGTGLGLNLCKKIVELHDGMIWVKSEVGKGSEFAFVIPRTNLNGEKREGQG